MTPTRQPERTGIERRTFLKAGATLATGSLATGTATATSKLPDGVVHEGESAGVGDGEVTAYATADLLGNLSSLGVHIDGRALDAFGDTPVVENLQFPGETDGSGGVNTHQFTFLGVDYNPEGHPPEDIYTVPHFDFHFYMLDESTVETIEAGPAQYSIPEAQIPEDYVRPPMVDTDGDGEPDAPLVEGQMGEHLIDSTSPEFRTNGGFTHTGIYGAYDPDGDGVGQLTFIEPMVTAGFLDELDEVVDVDLKTPAEYFTADVYPTSYAMEPDVTGGVYVSIGDFTEFPGPPN